MQTHQEMGKMNGVTRLTVFCMMTIVLPTILIVIPLYLKHQVFAVKKFSLAESDVIAISEGISSIFCQSHTLKMNVSFNAFQIHNTPRVNKNNRKHIRLKKSMSLPDDTLEYWGFYLLAGATVRLKVCSRYDGARLLVVRGDRHLQTCGLLEHNLKKNAGAAKLDDDYKQVRVTFEHFETVQAATDTNDPSTGKQHHHRHVAPTQKTTHHLRHSGREMERTPAVGDEGLATSTMPSSVPRGRRNARDLGQQLDAPIEHGGNAINYTVPNSDESMSSFEQSLLTCYDGAILLTQDFDPSHLCRNVHHLDHGAHMETVHEVVSDGYYYYIFYSDNDLTSNYIHAVFDIHKPTFEYSGDHASHLGRCLNETVCNFPVGFWTDDTVVVEVPTHDGIEIHEDDVAYLTSTCHPRMAVYVVFPVVVLFLILGFAFL